MRKLETYRFKDGQTPLSAEELNKRFFDLDARLDALENIKIDWQEAVREVTNYGLIRINEILGPSFQDIQEKKQIAQNIVNEIQALRNQADAAINQSRDDAISQAINEINEKISLVYVALAIGL